MQTLNWPTENATSSSTFAQWSHDSSNIILDFHGDPLTAKLVVYSDGNHHMALQESAQAFLKLNPAVEDVFYVTTPPNVIINALKSGGFSIGNLQLSIKPDVFISPNRVMDKLVEDNYCSQYLPFIKSRGCVALVEKGNPYEIQVIKDLMKQDVCLFMSNPETESMSHQVYMNYLANAGLTQTDIDSIKILYGSKIHHREVPQAIVDEKANVAIVYNHLALRYCRIFPELFEIIEILPLDDERNPSTEYSIASINTGEKFSKAFFQFMKQPQVEEIYKSHGLRSLNP